MVAVRATRSTSHTTTATQQPCEGTEAFSSSQACHEQRAAETGKRRQGAHQMTPSQSNMKMSALSINSSPPRSFFEVACIVLLAD